MVTRASIVDVSKRDGCGLADGWTWSTRHIEQVKSDDYTIRVMGGDVLFRTNKRHGGYWLKVWPDVERDDYPVLKMALLTYHDEIIGALAEKYSSSMPQ